MSIYRRAYIQGASYFFTVCLADRKSDRLTQNVGALRTAIRRTKRDLPFRIDAIVILPEHLHCVWTLPEHDCHFSSRWQRIKSLFSHACPGDDEPGASRARKRERRIWQRRFWEHMVRNEQDLAAHVDYIHFNPIKHGYVRRVIDWPYSSFHRYVRSKLLPADWAGGSEFSGDFGEPR